MDDAAIWTCLQCCEKQIEILAVFLQNPVITVTNVMRCFVRYLYKWDQRTHSELKLTPVCTERNGRICNSMFNKGI